jgi:hypothetical protein
MDEIDNKEQKWWIFLLLRCDTARKIGFVIVYKLLSIYLLNKKGKLRTVHLPVLEKSKLQRTILI